jgi:hypothetical protein
MQTAPTRSGRNGVGVGGHSATNDGVRGESDGSGKSGVLGINSSSRGYGEHFAGGLAPLLLEPATTAGKPTTGHHLKRELFLDSNGVLFFRIAGGTRGNPAGNWKQVQLI